MQTEPSIRPFADRAEAGRMLARQLREVRLPGPVVILALPRGGVPVAAQIAESLGAPIDLLLVRKIRAPWHPELAVAALVDGTPPQVVVNEELSASSGVDEQYLETQVRRAQGDIDRLRHVYLGGRDPLPVNGATVIVVDDGIATGTTMRAALRALRLRRPARLILAVPVAPLDVVEGLRGEVDEIVCLQAPGELRDIGLFYREFSQVNDEEVMAALARADLAGWGEGGG